MNHDQQVAAVLTEALATIEDGVWTLYEAGKDDAAIRIASGLVASFKAYPAHATPAMGLFEQALKEMGEDAVHAVLKAFLDQHRSAQKTKSDPWQNPDYSRMTPR